MNHLSKIVTIKIDAIKIRNRIREPDREQIKLLAESIQSEGLFNPIVISNKKELKAGYCRLLACKYLGRKSIETRVSKSTTKLVEIDENLFRQELTVLERSVHLYIRSTYQKDFARFKQTCSKLSGVSRRTIERQIRIGSILLADHKKLLTTPIRNNQADLLKLCSLPDELRKRAITILVDRRVDSYKEAKLLAETERVSEIQGAPLTVATANEASTEQFNFQLLPSQKLIVENAIRQSIETGRKEKPKPKASQSNALTRICDFYLKNART